MDNFDLRNFLIENKLTFQSQLKEAASVQDIITKIKNNDFESLNNMPGDQKLVQTVVNTLKVNNPDLIKKLTDFAEQNKNNLSEIKINKNSFLAVMIGFLLGIGTTKMMSSKSDSELDQGSPIKKTEIQGQKSIRSLNHSPKIIKFLKYEEGSASQPGKPVLKMYRGRNEAGKTISWGCYYSNYKELARALGISEREAKKVWNGRVSISLEQAQKLFDQKVNSLESSFKQRMISKYPNLKLTQNQYDALFSVYYNRGAGAFFGSNNTDYLDYLEQDDIENAGKSLKNAYTNPQPGLATRRAAEMDIFLNNTYKSKGKSI